MSDSRLERLAEVLVDYSTEVREGEIVLVEAPDFAAPLAREVCRRVLRAGGHPQPLVAIEGPEESLLANGSDRQLEWFNPIRRSELLEASARIVVAAVWNTRALTNIDPGRQALYRGARAEATRLIMDRGATGELRWVVTTYPSQAAAQDAAMSFDEWQDFVYRAAFLDREDPIGEWRRFAVRLEEIAGWLEQRNELRIVAEDTDLTIGIRGRGWVPSSGQGNLPDGEVYTGPVEDATEGAIRFSYPAVFQGRGVEDVRLRFEAGKVVEARAARAQEFLDRMLEVDDGARRLGEFAFGLNDAVPRFTRNTLFDEKIGGTVHLALGAAYPETGAVNRSALHWDMVCDLRSGGEVYADGELVYRDGRFLDGVVS